MAQVLSQKNRGVLVVYINEPKLLDERLINEVGRALLAALDQAENEMLLVNFQGVRFMSSSMIGRIVALYKKCKAGKINLKLSNISAEIMEVFELMRLHKLLSLCADEADAMTAFEKDGWLR